MFNLSRLYGEYTANPADALGPPLGDGNFQSVIDEINEDPTRITDAEVWEPFLSSLPPNALADEIPTLVATVSHGLETVKSIAKDVKNNSDTAMFGRTLEALEKYAFAAFVLLGNIDDTLVASVQQPMAKKSRAAIANEISGPVDLAAQLFSALGNVVAVGLDALLPTTQMRDVFASMYIKPAFRMLENEHVASNPDIVKHLFRVLSLGLKYQGQLTTIQTSAIQLLNYYPHVAEPLADLLLILHNEYDNTALASLILKDVGGREFTAQDFKGPKPIAAFILHLSKILPKVVMQHISQLLQLIDSQSSTMRMAMLEVLGYLVGHLLAESENQTGEDPEVQKKAIDDLVEVIMLHCNDSYSFCRSRSLQVMAALCDTIYIKQAYRRGFPAIASQKTNDKSQIVRHNGMRLMNKLIKLHPFNLVQGSQLNFQEWTERRDRLVVELDEIIGAEPDASLNLEEPTSEAESTEREIEGDVEADQANEADANMADGGTEETEETDGVRNESAQGDAAAPAANKVSGDDAEVVHKLRLMLQYHEDALKFVTEINKCLSIAELLLRSKNKTDVVDSMDLFVLADAYGVAAARTGIRKMVHCVWAKANNDEKDTIQKHVVNCYSDLFMSPPSTVSEQDAALYVAKSLISLTFNATTGELTSLEFLLGLAMKEALIKPNAVRVLWRIFAYDAHDIPRKQRLGAAIILSFLSKHDRNIALSGLDTVMSVGLGLRGQKDPELAKWSGVILQHCMSSDDWRKGEIPKRLSSEHEVFGKLKALVLKPAFKPSWFGMAQELLRAINDLAQEPQEVFSAIIREYDALVFPPDLESADTSRLDDGVRQALFAQLIFVAGEVSIRLLVHLERCEIAFKRAKLNAEETATAAKKNAQEANDVDTSMNGDDELDMVASGGTAEDDFMDALHEIKERELLYSERSLLTRYANIAVDLCKDDVASVDGSMLSIAATSSLTKFMCVSSVYCEANMELMMGVMRKSESPTIRSNVVVAMGDMAVCFNHIMDSHTNFLYGQLNDRFPVVQRTAVVTLTFLILGGQVKIKGQLGEMAKALESPDKKISSLAHMFFSELSTKENAVYNTFLDILSTISADMSIEQNALHRIVRFLLSFIEKERHVKQLTEKILAKVTRCEDERQWKLFKYVLETLPGDKSEAVAQVLDQEFTGYGTVAS